MLEHPGVIAYHAEYPAEAVSDDRDLRHRRRLPGASRQSAKGKAPLGAVVAACAKITCRCFGDPDPASREILKGFGTTYHDTAPEAFVLHPRADRDSPRSRWPRRST